MGFTKTENKLRRELHRQIIDEIKELALDGELLNVRKMMKKWEFSRNDYRRMVNLFEWGAKQELKEEGYIFRCIYGDPEWLWGIPDTEEKMKAVMERSVIIIKGRLKVFNQIKKEALKLGYKEHNLPLLEEGNANEGNTNGAGQNQTGQKPAKENFYKSAYRRISGVN